MRSGGKRPGQRSCIGCGRKTDKRELLRFVRSEEGRLRFDPKQIAPGRGGYLCPHEACFAAAVRKRRLSNRFRGQLKEDLASLMRYLDRAAKPGSTPKNTVHASVAGPGDAEGQINRTPDPAAAPSGSDA